MRNAQGFPAVGVIFRAGFSATVRGIAPLRASPLTLRLLQRFPNAAQDKLRMQLACCGPCIKNSWGSRVQPKKPLPGFPFGNGEPLANRWRDSGASAAYN